MQNQIRYDPAPGAPFQWLLDSLMGAVSVCVDQDPSLTEVERAVGLQITALRDTQEALKMLGERRLGKREKAAKPLLLVYLHKIRGNTLSRTWEKGLATGSRVSDKMDLLAKDTTRFMAALNLVTHPNTPFKAIGMTVRKYKNNVEELH
jgi:hypothetical protein